MDRNLSKDDAQARSSVIEEAVQCLQNIHNAFVSAVNVEVEAREDAKRRRIIYTLLDLISIEGVYPCLSTNVGIPLEKRVISHLPTGVIARQAPEMTSDKPRNEDLLYRILLTLSGILLDETGGGIQALVRGRVLSDVISAAADLGFNSCQISSEEKLNAQGLLDMIITKYTHPLGHTVDSIIINPS